MKYLGKIQDNKDLVTKEYVDGRSGVTGVKGNSESTYRTGNVNITAANTGAIPANSSGNTQNLARPAKLNGLNDNTLDSKINTLRANRLAFLPADQIIIEKTTDGGTTWVDAGVADSTKTGLFSETRAGVNLPLLNGVKSLLCGIRITFTAMKYNVPSGTAETAKYNYWNSNYIASAERYNQLKEMYFWVSTNSDTIGIKVQRATGAASTNWVTIFDDSSFLMTGWSGCDYLRFSQGVFGGGTNQTSNYWNYRITLMTKGTTASGGATLATTYTTSAQSVMEIRAYGDTWWTAGNEYAANDKIYTHDYLKNVTFPANITANRFIGQADAVRDSNNGNNITIRYGGSGISSATWYPAYNGYKIEPISAQNLANSAIGALDNTAAQSTAPTDNTSFITTSTTGATGTYYHRKASLLWTYIKDKISSVLGLTETNYGGTAANSSKVNNHTVAVDVPSGAKFTDTVTTATTTGSGNAVTKITASNGALTVTKGMTFAEGSHSHGGITTSGKFNIDSYPDVTIASGDMLLIVKGSNTNIRPTSITFDGETTSRVLSRKGTWVTLPSVPSSGTDAELTAGTATSTRVWTPKILHDYIASHGGGGGTSISVTLASSGWSNNSITVTATGVTASNNVIVSPAPASYNLYSMSGIYCSAQAANSLTFTCASVPSSAITVNVLIM